MPQTITLSAPITSHKGTMTEINVREPKARELIKYVKLPWKILADGSFEVNYDLAGKYLSDLSGVELPALEDMSAADFNSCVAAIVKLTANLPASEAPASTNNEAAA